MTRTNPDNPKRDTLLNNLFRSINKDPVIKGVKRAWFTVSISILITACLIFISLPKEQVIGTLIDYGPEPGASWYKLKWSRILIVNLSFLFLTISLAYWTAKLLMRISRLRGIKRDGLLPRQQYIIVAVYVLPWIGLALAYWGAAEALTPDGGLMIFFTHPFAYLPIVTLIIFLQPVFIWHHQLLDSLRSNIYGEGEIQSLLARFATIVLVVLSIIFVISPYWGIPHFNSVGVARFLGPIAITAIGLGVFTSLGSWLLLMGRRHKLAYFAMVILVVFIWGALNINDNHPVRGVIAEKPAEKKEFSEVAADWAKSRGVNTSTDPELPYIIVSAEGGGVRAAYFTASILGRLVDRCPDAARRIVAISSVSGGSVGAAAYVAAVHNNDDIRKRDGCNFNENSINNALGAGNLEQRLQKILGEDHLSPILARAVFPDAVGQLLPLSDSISFADRQLGLEHSLSRSFSAEFGHDQIRAGLSNFALSDKSPFTPILFINTTQVSDGSVVAGSQFQFKKEKFQNIKTFGDVDSTFDPTLISIAATSARFPYLSPAGYIGNGVKRERFVDGGYFDNSGAEVSQVIYRKLWNYLNSVPSGSENEGDNTSLNGQQKIILVHIGNGLEKNCQGIEKKANRRGCPDDKKTGRFSEMLSPLQAVLNTRSGRTDLTVSTLEELSAAPNNTTVVKFQLYDCDVKVPLGWYLSDVAESEMRAQLTPADDDSCRNGAWKNNQRSFNKLGAFFGDG
ncbi:MAG: patatin-like phospholipase family protein [Pseudomonadota bacterium]